MTTEARSSIYDCQDAWKYLVEVGAWNDVCRQKSI